MSGADDGAISNASVKCRLARFSRSKGDSGRGLAQQQSLLAEASRLPAGWVAQHASGARTFLFVSQQVGFCSGGLLQQQGIAKTAFANMANEVNTATMWRCLLISPFIFACVTWTALSENLASGN